MTKISTLTELLNESGCDYLIFDLSRRVSQIPPADFAKIEEGQMPYPAPVQRKANLAISYWNKKREPWIWFLKFELDERGLLKSTDIGQFIRYVIEAMGSRLSDDMTEEQQEKLANNPYTYRPPEEKLAIFHSLLRAKLNLPCSQYYEHAQHYMSGGLGWDNWQTVGLQGISDICARISHEQNSILLRKALRQLPNPPKYALLGVLEHIELPNSLAKTLEELTEDELKKTEIDLFLLAAYVRALAGAQEKQLASVCRKLLNDPFLSHKEILIAIAGRSASILRDPILAQQFLIRLAESNDQNFFNQIFADLVMQPTLRHVFLTLLHSDATEELQTALLTLQQSTKRTAR
ncbi:DUF3549 family protein [Vibrio salinus]|uniref:DUF3549 family protein n=1 Tax=Vibrio salinus TaxID=2899784 RepID=UPI001E5AACE2|nr:DUF3549 family protein [Vibrio salinus]MCE0493062.1 DUF3549 family protein [Vibrio salinus]